MALRARDYVKRRYRRPPCEECGYEILVEVVEHEDASVVAPLSPYPLVATFSGREYPPRCEVHVIRRQTLAPCCSKVEQFAEYVLWYGVQFNFGGEIRPRPTGGFQFGGIP